MHEGLFKAVPGSKDCGSKLDGSLCFAKWPESIVNSRDRRSLWTATMAKSLSSGNSLIFGLTVNAPKTLKP